MDAFIKNPVKVFPVFIVFFLQSLRIELDRGQGVFYFMGNSLGNFFPCGNFLSFYQMC